MKVFHMIDEDEDEDADEEPRAPTAVPEDVELDEEPSLYSCDHLGKGVAQTSSTMVADAAAVGPLLGVPGADRGGRGSSKPTCTLVRVSTYTSSLNQPINR
jgi:hypothetical protein